MIPERFAIFIAEGRLNTVSKFWYSPKRDLFFPIIVGEHMEYVHKHIDKFKLSSSEYQEISSRLDHHGYYSSWNDSFEELFRAGWVRGLIITIGGKTSEVELHGYKEDLPGTIKYLRKNYIDDIENIKAVTIENEYTNHRGQSLSDPLKIKRFMNSGKI